MVDDSITFGFALFVMLLGMAVLLFGVYLGGDPLNTVMIVGGVVTVVGITLHTAGILRLEDGHAAE